MSRDCRTDVTLREYWLICWDSRHFSLSGPPSPAIRTDHIGSDDPRWNFPGFPIEKIRCWGPIAIAIVNRMAGEAICQSDCHRLTYFLTDFHATMQDDERSEWECDLLLDHFVFRPPDTTLWSNLTAVDTFRSYRAMILTTISLQKWYLGVPSISNRDTTFTIR